ncbi:chemotaxis protein [Enterobacter sp. CC120223-11]|uniref:chemotaxis protein n=1 Tax=Enterobacter sp. CC120223-11 TaxID=1378073 RepID=UPI000BDD8EEF|nr:chemotaxis protein [Enterobacter sp. CC120223-11]SNY67782.1 methyl-accepting chemotaxis protein [Enterobacter sp. CC120223-11]
MILTVILVFVFIGLLIAIQYGVMPRVIKSEGVRLRSQVDALAVQLREQLDRVEAQQRSMTESVVTLKSYALERVAPGQGEFPEETSLPRHFFNALVKEMGERLGGRVWLVDGTGGVVGEASGIATPGELELPMAVPLRGLLAQAGEGLRQTRFRSASGEHTLIVQPIPESSWLVAIDMPSRRLAESSGGILHKPWPVATLLLVSTLTLLRSLNQHLTRMNEELPTLLKSEVESLREQGAQLPSLVKEMGEHIAVIARAATDVAQKNERLLCAPEQNANRIAMLAESVINVAQAMQVLQQAAQQTADSAGALVQLASRAYSYSLHDEEGVFAVSSREMAQRCARSSRELRALISDPVMQVQSQSPSVAQNDSVLIEEVYTVANALLQKAGVSA